MYIREDPAFLFDLRGWSSRSLEPIQAQAASAFFRLSLSSKATCSSYSIQFRFFDKFRKDRILYATERLAEAAELCLLKLLSNLNDSQTGFLTKFSDPGVGSVVMCIGHHYDDCLAASLWNLNKSSMLRVPSHSEVSWP